MKNFEIEETLKSIQNDYKDTKKQLNKTKSYLRITSISLVVLGIVTVVGFTGMSFYQKDKLAKNDIEMAKLENSTNGIVSTRENGGNNPAGTVISFMGNSVPTGYLKCEGQTVSRTEYKALFTAIGTTYGAGDGSTTFNVPDLRGEFLRGSGTNSHGNQGNGENVGVHQDSTIVISFATGADGGFGHYFRGVAMSQSNYDKVMGTSTAYSGITGNIDTSNWAKNKATNGSVRPTNTSVLYCIKY